MMRLDVLSTAVAQTCNGYNVPSSIRRADGKDALMGIIGQPGGLSAIAGMANVCKAITHMANTGKISGAAARAFYHQLFGDMIYTKSNRHFNQWRELILSEEYKGVFDLTGITIRDAEFNFASVDFPAMVKLLEQTMREMKMKKLQTNILQMEKRMQPPQLNKYTYSHAVRLAARL